MGTNQLKYQPRPESLKNLKPEASLKHGAWSNDPVVPAEIEQELKNAHIFIMSQPQVIGADIMMVQRILQKYKMLRLMEFWAEKTGGEYIVNNDGDIRPKSCFNGLYVALDNSFSRDLDRLGLNPRARKELKILDVSLQQKAVSLEGMAKNWEKLFNFKGINENELGVGKDERKESAGNNP